jgi:adenine deaminase
MPNSFSISGNIVDILNKKIYPGTVTVENSKITKIEKNENKYDSYIMPVSSMRIFTLKVRCLIPSEFARIAVIHGTVATVS